jgi:GAF domain-containing protein
VTETGREDEAARQAARAQDAELGEGLRQLLLTVGAADAVMPRRGRPETLALVVRTAARVLSARAASLFLIDDTGKELVFEVAIGPKAEEVSQFRVPIGHGIAGVVAATGQPMAISAPEQDPRFAAEIARTVNYMPQSILCVPLRHGDTIIGVLEVLDKEGRDSFTTGDIEVLSQFAELAAQAAEQVRRQDELRAALAAIVNSWTGDGRLVEQRDALLRGIDEALLRTRASPEYAAAMAIAQAVREIATAGEAERALCHDWLTRFAAYLRERNKPLPAFRPWTR